MFKVVWVFLAFIVVLSVGISKSMANFEWFVWYFNGSKPQVFDGFLEDVYKYKGRDSGKFRLKIVNGKEEVFLHGVMDLTTLRVLENNGKINSFYFYLTPTGSKYVYKIINESQVYYEKPFKEFIWPGILMVMLNIFLFSIAFFMFSYLRKEYGSNK